MKTSKITFDCNEEIHSQAKIKAINSKISLKQYIVDLIVNDLKQDEKPNERSVSEFIDEHHELMKGLASR